MEEKTTLREFLKTAREEMEDIDIYVDGVDDEIAYCGTGLTEEGMKHYKAALDLPIQDCTVSSDNAEDYDLVDDEEGSLWLAWEMLAGMAGFCSCKDYDRYFKA